MEPQIRYCTTSDGVSIAYHVLGAGPPMVWANLPFSHLQVELRNPQTVAAYEAAARLVKLVRYDHRGFGLSDRHVTSFALDALVLDLEAVVDRLELDPFILLSGAASSPMALRYVACNPGRASHLVLYPGFARPDGIGWKQWESLAGTAADDWDFVSETAMRAVFGYEDEESLRLDVDLLRSAVSPASFVRYMGDARSWDAGPYVRDVTIPTLLLQQADARYTTMEAARRVASELPDGRLVIVEGATAEDRRVETFAAVADLVGVALPAVPARDVQRGGTAVILFADIVESTALTERMGDAAFRTKARELDVELRRVIAEAGGTTIEGKLLGDGVLATFPAASQAIDAALRCGIAGADGGLPLHLGLHAGDVIREDGNVFGGAVNIASRISGLSVPGEVLVSDIVRGLARTSAGVVFEDRGEFALKGIVDAVRVYAVRAQDGE